MLKYSIPLVPGNLFRLTYNAVDSVIADRFMEKESLAAAFLGVVLSKPLLKALRVPDEILTIAAIYLSIIFMGVPFTYFYNAVSAALKSAGDSKTPLKEAMINSPKQICRRFFRVRGMHLRA